MRHFNKIILVLALLVISSEAKFMQSDAIQLHFLAEPFRVQGSASISLAPELVCINLTAQTLDNEARISLQQNSAILNQVIEAFKKLGLKEDEFQTSELQIFPSYNYTYNSQGIGESHFEGYKVHNNLIVTTKQLDLAGEIIDAAVQNGVTIINSISYSPLSSTVEESKKKLIAEAVNNAKENALIVAKELKLQLKSIKNINMINSNPQPYSNYMAKAQQYDSTPVYATSDTLNVQVEVVFIIEESD